MYLVQYAVLKLDSESNLKLNSNCFKYDNAYSWTFHFSLRHKPVKNNLFMQFNTLANDFVIDRCCDFGIVRIFCSLGERVNPPYRPYTHGSPLKLFLDIVPSCFEDVTML